MEEQVLALPAHTKKHEHHTDPWRDPSADLQCSLCTLPPSFRHFHFLHSEDPFGPSTVRSREEPSWDSKQGSFRNHCCSCCLPDCMSVRYLMQCLHLGSLCDEIKWGWTLLIIPAFISTAEYLLMRCLWLCSFPTHLMFLSPSGSNLAISTF